MLRKKIFKRRLTNFFFEVAIIIVGILLSLMISNWVQGRKDNQKEDAYLLQIKADLEDDLKRLEADLDARDVQLDFVITTLQAINAPEEEVDLKKFTDGLKEWITTVTFIPNEVTFRSLENTGQLQLIDNQKVVKGLLDLYTNSYGSLKLNNDDVTIYRNNFLVPYVIENIDMNAALYREESGGVELVVTDQKFTNHLLYNQISLLSTQGAYERSITHVQQLLELVKTELK